MTEASKLSRQIAVRCSLLCICKLSLKHFSVSHRFPFSRENTVIPGRFIHVRHWADDELDSCI